MVAQLVFQNAAACCALESERPPGTDSICFGVWWDLRVRLTHTSTLARLLRLCKLRQICCDVYVGLCLSLSSSYSLSLTLSLSLCVPLCLSLSSSTARTGREGSSRRKRAQRHSPRLCPLQASRQSRTPPLTLSCSTRSRLPVRLDRPSTLCLRTNRSLWR